jgi:hypothetical protein
MQMVTGGLTTIEGVDYYRIDGVEHLQPFLMTVVSESDLWMFVSSTGVLTAGRVDADRSLFSYQTVDRIHRAAGISGPVTVIAREFDGERRLWRPFSADHDKACTRSIAKSVLGDRLMCIERHADWAIEFRATWAPSSTHGWVRTVEIVDTGDAGAELEVLDGFIDVMPAGVDAHTEQTLSNLVDSYKRSEAGPWGSLAVFNLETLVSDRAEPAESLTATALWSTGFDGAELDLDERGLDAMIAGRDRQSEQLVTGRPGAYLLRGKLAIPSAGSTSWMFVADMGLGNWDVRRMVRTSSAPEAAAVVLDDVAAGSQRLSDLLGGADAFQSTGDGIADAHHVSNVLFNSMRGGVFPFGQEVPVAELATFVRDRNQIVAERNDQWLGSLGEWVESDRVRDAAIATGDGDLIRLVLEFLPLVFSRRHGDPSRPWNRFSINVRDSLGEPLLAYEGNWRDIFQNWEALVESFPSYFVNIVAKFVNASTIDGHNPYRISGNGIDWEVPDPHDPWSHIGYWGDHQIVYLLRLLEAWERHEPAAITGWLDRAVFAYADVPYRIADHDAMVRDPRHTIDFDDKHAATIERRETSIGADGRLVVDADGDVLSVGLLEKLLVPALAKLSSFVPGGGIWMNTQRPEWNDANNALAGHGLSMVTLYHLHRYLGFVQSQLERCGAESALVTPSIGEWCRDLLDVFHRIPVDSIDDTTRRRIVDELGTAATEHRQRVALGTSRQQAEVAITDLVDLCSVARDHLGGAIAGAQGASGLYQSYNWISFPTADTAVVAHLGPMLEGQVAALSSGALDHVAALDLIDSLYRSDMYRADQDSFMLYPNLTPAPFLDRNVVPDAALVEDPWIVEALDDSLRSILVADLDGAVHFRPDLTNGDVLAAKLEQTNLSSAEAERVTDLYEDVFRHNSFTGRSGSMYGYEGLGSVYWHMVAKLLLAVQETYWSALDDGAPDDVVRRLADAYRRVRAGLGFRKSPEEYGAFPTDCYSHTPGHSGAEQPGMTGQVKEEILTRFGEIGLRVVEGRLHLMPGLLPADELFSKGADGTPDRASLTYCSVPMTIGLGDVDEVVVVSGDGRRERRSELSLTSTQSAELFARDGAIAAVEWTLSHV